MMRGRGEGVGGGGRVLLKSKQQVFRGKQISKATVVVLYCMYCNELLTAKVLHAAVRPHPRRNTQANHKKNESKKVHTKNTHTHSLPKRHSTLSFSGETKSGTGHPPPPPAPPASLYPLAHTIARRSTGILSPIPPSMRSASAFYYGRQNKNNRGLAPSTVKQRGTAKLMNDGNNNNSKS